MTSGLRALPLTPAPVNGETLGSYLNRLADANHLTIGELSRLLGPSRRHKRTGDNLTGWNAATLARLSDLTRRPPLSLIRALPALQELQTFPTPTTAAPSRALTERLPCPACHLCMARQGITGLVVRLIAAHETVCLRHRKWLPGPDQHHLDRLPEVLNANVRHRRLLRKHHLAAADAHHDAEHLTRTWFTTTAQPDLRERWKKRLHILGEDPYGDPEHPTPQRIALATYPETIALTGLLTSAHWHHHPGFLAEATRRLGTTLQASPELDQLGKRQPR